MKWLNFHGWVIGVAKFLVLLQCLSVSGLAQEGFKVLVFSKTSGFRHSSIPNGIAMIHALGQTGGFAVEASENSAVFTDAGLAPYAAVIFLCTTGDILNSSQQAAFERFIRQGGGFAGIHSASDTEYNWPWYGRLVGAYFQSHPAIQSASVQVTDPAHPSTAHLPAQWQRTDEWYNFRTNPRGKVHVLASLNEGSYSAGAGAMGFDHPIAWCHEFEGGRAWYTGGGHTENSYAEPHFRQHVLGGILWAAGRAEGDAGATLDKNFEKVILDGAPTNPMELAIAADGRVFYVERGGRVRIHQPDSGLNVTAGEIAVNAQNEDGLLGIALDPDFSSNQWVYLFYSPAGSEPQQHVSRFTMTGDILDENSERVLLKIAVQRNRCCHSGGSLAFGPEGNLYIAVGDNTNPFESNGYAPIDEQPDRSDYDAQGSSSNPNDLRGKILRIRPQADGTYTIPPGNLFPADGSAGRPEIFVMGCRNPFRISVDQRTGWLYWGDVGPDAHTAHSDRGPAGHDEWNQTRTAGNYGWPYFVANNKPYREYDFASGISGPPYEPAAPVNNSPNNTGHAALPPSQPAWIWYPYSASAEFPEVNQGIGRCAMGGPVYHSNPGGGGRGRLPAYYDGKVFIYEWARGWIKEITLNSEGNLLKINPFLPELIFRRPIDLEIGPDGVLYLIEWGTNFGGGNADAAVSKIIYKGGATVRLQASAAAHSTFVDDPTGVVNAQTRTVTIPMPAGSAARFYRLRSTVRLTITGAQAQAGELVLQYQ